VQIDAPVDVVFHFHDDLSVQIDAPVDVVFHFHDDPRNLLRITPPEVKIELLEVRGEEPEGREIRMRMTQFGVLRNELLIRFVTYDPPHLLIDEQREGPFRFWRQTRQFEEIGEATRLTDIVEYEVPFGIPGRLMDRFVIAPRIRAMFEYRQQRTRAIIEGGYRRMAD